MMTPEVLPTHIARIDKALAENKRRRKQVEDPLKQEVQYHP
jgi:hypothetical protein